MGAILEIFSYVFWVLLAITILVFVHEMGHFLAAKLFGMRVDRFSIGFPPVLAGKQVGETEYVIGATPLGGYVKIAGMIDESMDTDFVDQEPEPYEYRAKPVWQRIIVITAGVIFNLLLAAVIYTGFNMVYGDTYVPARNVKSVHVEGGSVAYRMGLRTGDRVVGLNGEPLEHFDALGDLTTLTADSLTVTVERGGRRRTFTAPKNLMTQLARAARHDEGFGVTMEPTLVGDVVGDSPAEAAGLQAGDRITALGGEPVRFWAQMTEKIQSADGGALAIRWTRPDSLLSEDAASNAASGENAASGDTASPARLVRLTPGQGGLYEARLTPRYDSTAGSYVIGVYGATPAMIEHEFGVKHTRYGPGEALAGGVEETWSTTGAIAESLRRVFFGRDSFRENVGGPVAIAQVTKQAADRGARAFWNIVAFLSITLAIMNILPIPALDGGHLVFLLYEGITRRRPSAKVRMALQQIGFVVLIAFMAFVIFNDILRL